MSSHYLNQWELYVFLGTTATNIYEKWLLSFHAVVFSIVLDILSSHQTGDVSEISVINWHYIWQLWWLQLSYGNQDCSITVLICLISSQHKPVLCAVDYLTNSGQYPNHLLACHLLSLMVFVNGENNWAWHNTTCHFWQFQIVWSFALIMQWDLIISFTPFCIIFLTGISKLVTT